MVAVILGPALPKESITIMDVEISVVEAGEVDKLKSLVPTEPPSTTTMFVGYTKGPVVGINSNYVAKFTVDAPNNLRAETIAREKLDHLCNSLTFACGGRRYESMLLQRNPNPQSKIITPWHGEGVLSPILQVRKFEVSRHCTPLEIQNIEVIDHIISDDKTLRKSVFYWQEGHRMFERMHGTIDTFLTLFKAIELLAEQVAKKHRKEINKQIEQEQLQVVEDLILKLDAKKLGKSVHQITEASSLLRRARMEFLDLKVDFCCVELGLSQEQQKVARELAKLRNTSAAHGSLDGQGVNDRHVDQAEQISRSMISKCIDRIYLKNPPW